MTTFPNSITNVMSFFVLLQSEFGREHSYGADVRPGSARLDATRDLLKKSHCALPT
jgi:hypothetical protein